MWCALIKTEGHRNSSSKKWCAALSGPISTTSKEMWVPFCQVHKYWLKARWQRVLTDVMKQAYGKLRSSDDRLKLPQCNFGPFLSYSKTLRVSRKNTLHHLDAKKWMLKSRWIYENTFVLTFGKELDMHCSRGLRTSRFLWWQVITGDVVTAEGEWG